jgi:hypothetical protein
MNDGNNLKLTRGIHVNKEQQNRNSWIYDNTVTLNTGAMFVRNESGAIHMRNNTRSNSGALYTLEFGATVDDVIPSTLPAKGTYTGFGGTVTPPPSSVGSSSSTPSVASSSRSSTPPSSRSSSSSSSVASGTCLAYTDRMEADLSSKKCIDVPGGLAGKTVQVWDSDTNTSCDFRGTITTDATGSLNVNSNYVSTTALTGNQLRFSFTGCPYVKIRVF